MTPDQHLSLATQQCANRVKQARQWLVTTPMEHDVLKSGVRESLSAISARLAAAARAQEGRPAIGIVGAAGLNPLILRAAHERRDRTPGPNNRRVDLERLSVLLSAHATAGIASLRLWTGDDADAPLGNPMAFSLFTIWECAAVIARAAHIVRPDATGLMVDPVRVRTVFEAAGQNLVLEAAQDFSEADTVALRARLEQTLPLSPALASLAASGYWTHLADMGPHLDDSDRVAVLALLWGEQPHLTRAFSDVMISLNDLGHATTVFAPADAMVTRDPDTRRLHVHPQAIATTAGLGGIMDAANPTIRVVDRYGRYAVVPRAHLAFLAAEQSCWTAYHPFTNVEPADLLLLANPGPAGDEIVASLLSDGPIDPDAARDAIAAAKRLEAFERSLARFDATALIAAVDTAQGADDAIAPSLADWIAATHGSEPHARERVRSGLIVALLDHAQPASANDPHANTGSADAASRASMSDRQDAAARFDACVRANLCPDGDWLDQWLPDQPFADVVAISAPAAHTGQPTGADWPPIGTPVHAGDEASATFEAVLAALSPVTTRATRRLHIQRAVATCDRVLRARMLTFRDGDDPGVALERDQLTTLARHRLDRLARVGRIGELMACLSVNADDIAVLLFGEPFDGALDGLPYNPLLDERTLLDGQPGGIAWQHWHPQDPRDMAKRAVTHWFAHMRGETRRPRRIRALMLPDAVVSHVVEEIAIGAVRIGLIERLAAALAGGDTGDMDQASADDAANGIGAAHTIADVINRFLATLAVQSAPSSQGDVSGAFGMARGGLPAAALTGARPAITGHDAPGAHAGRVWVSAWAALAAGNLADPNAAISVGDQELARLLSRSAINEVEVKL